MNILEKYRKENGLTYAELGERMGHKPCRVWKWCKKGIRCPASIISISELLNLETSTVLKEMTERKEKNG
jgi:hypothetical protein